jgi:hypothetical protein
MRQVLKHIYRAQTAVSCNKKEILLEELKSATILAEQKILQSASTDNSAIDSMQEMRAVINGKGDSVTKVLKCKDILARH